MSYGSVVGHQAMVFDEIRNGFYREALRAKLAPGARVMDLGAGLGILGLIALEEGASEVVMVEPSPVLRAARTLARSLGLESRIRFIEKRIEEVEEDFEVDAIVSVFTGNFLLEEDLLPSLFHARDHFLAPGGSLFPQEARMRLMPVDAASLYDRRVARWSTPASGIDLSPLRVFAENSLIDVAGESSAFCGLAPPQTLAHFDFRSAREAACDAAVDFVINAEGVCHGLCGWFEARLGDHWFSTGPDAPGLHWSPLFLPIAEPMVVRPGQHVEAMVHRPMHGDWTWTLATEGRTQRQSSFLAQPVSTGELLRRSPAFRPRLGDEGAALAHLLAMFDGAHDLEDMAGELHARYPKLYPDRQHAFRTVQAFSARYGAVGQERD